MQADRLQLQRFEIKYLISESLALAARDFVRSYLVPDEFAANSTDFSYPVHSLYLDSDDLALYQQTINGDKNRYKLRIRFYNDEPAAPVFLEIKRRTNNVISKQRCGVQRAAVDAVLAGQIPESHLVFSKNPNHLFSLRAFTEMILLHRAKASGHVGYLREAWVSPDDNSVRVTMDRRVRFEAEPVARLSTIMRSPVSVFEPHVILEMKFTTRFPNWFYEFIRLFNLTQCSAAKYVEGVTAFGEQRLRNGFFSHFKPDSASQFSGAQNL